MATKSTVTTATTGKGDLVAITMTAAQADRLLDLLEHEIAGQKNRLVSAVLAGGDEADRAHARKLAADAESLNNVAAAFRRLKI